MAQLNQALKTETNVYRVGLRHSTAANDASFRLSQGNPFLADSEQSYGEDSMLTPLKKAFLVSAGCLSLGLGVIGAFLPLLPTVPLVLLAGYCFARSSETLHSWLLAHRYFGPIIENFAAGKGVPRRVKVRAISLIWLSMGVSGWIVGRPLLIVMLVAIGLAVSTYLWRMPEYQADS